MKHREVLILMWIVLADLATKTAAMALLPFQEYVPLIGQRLGFYLTCNPTFTNSFGARMASGTSDIGLIASCVGLLAVLGYVVFIRKKPLHWGYKILIGLGVWIFLSILSSAIGLMIPSPDLPGPVMNIIVKMTGLAIWGVVFYWATDKWARLSILAILACGVGNLLSSFYPPFMVIDFILAENPWTGVFNVADMAYIAGVIGLLLSLIAIAVRKIIRHFDKTSIENL